MITSTIWKGGTLESQVDGLLEGAIPRGRLLWIDAESPDADEVAVLAERFDLHPLLAEDILERDERPKLELFDGIGFVVAYSAELCEVAIALGEGWVIVVRNPGDDRAPWNPKSAVERMERTCPTNATSGFVLYSVLDELVDGYFAASDEIDDHLELLEDDIFSADPADEGSVQQRMFTVRRELVQLRRKVLPLRDVISAVLRGEVPQVDEPTRRLFQDVFDHLLRTVDLLDSQRELLGNAADAHLAIISNRMNSVMKMMTSWGAILLGATLVAGIYGMNFKHMPELDWVFGYPFALGIMGTITVVGYRLFRKRGWL